MILKQAQAQEQPPPPRPKNTHPINSGSGSGSSPSSRSNSAEPKSKATNPKSQEDQEGKEAVKILQRNILYYKQLIEKMDIGGNNNAGKFTSEQYTLEDEYASESITEKEPAGRPANYSNLNHPELRYDRDIQTGQETSDERAAHGNNQKEVLGRTNPFGNFLLNNFIPKKSLQLVDEDAPNDTRLDTKPGGKASDPTMFKNLLDTIGRVGTPKLRKPDPQEQKLEEQLKLIEQKHKNEIEEANRKAIEKEKIHAVKRTNPQLDRQQTNLEKAYSKKTGKNVYLNPNQITPLFLKTYDPQYKTISDRLDQLKIRLDKEYQRKNPYAKGEETIDGIFYIRTLNALKTINAFTKGFLDFGKAIGVSFQSFKEQNLNNFGILVKFFGEVIPGREYAITDNQKKIKAIDLLSQSIRMQCDLLEEVKSLIESKDMKDFINQNNSFMQLKTQKQQLVSDTEQKQQAIQSVMKNSPKGGEQNVSNFFSKYQNYIFSSVNINRINLGISFQNLSSINELKKLYVTAFETEPTKDQLLAFFYNIKKQIRNQQNYKKINN